MLEEVGDAADAVALVAGAGAVAHHHGDDGGGVVLLDNHLEAVAQRGGRNPGRGGERRRGQQQRGGERGEQPSMHRPSGVEAARGTPKTGRPPPGRQGLWCGAMKPWLVVDRAPAPGGGGLVLHQRGDEFAIRVNGRELMSSRQHGSEERMAEVACAALKGKQPRVLVGGLGLGYTVRAALDRLPAGGRVVVAELVPAVIAWNRGVLAPLAGRPLEDARVAVEGRDVVALLREADAAYDAVLLDVDNGPEALSQEHNRWLYGEAGLGAARRALRPDGVLVVWSASGDRAFANRMKRAGFFTEVIETPARQGAKTFHTLFVGRAR